MDKTDAVERADLEKKKLKKKELEKGSSLTNPLFHVPVEPKLQMYELLEVYLYYLITCSSTDWPFPHRSSGFIRSTSIM